MADLQLQRCSALSQTAPIFSANGFQLRELESVAKLRVQVLRSRGMHMPAVISEQLPDKPNTATGVDPIALWKAPDDWLAYSHRLTPSALCDWVAAIPSNAPLVVTDVSSASTVFELNGTRALDILMRDCTLDLEGNAVPPGACAQTLFAQTTILIQRPSVDTWRLFVERSVARHVWEWLLASS